MRILLINYEFPPIGGGGSYASYKLAKKLVDLGYEIDVVTMGYKNLPRKEQVGDINIFRMPGIRSKKHSSNIIEMLVFIVLAVPQVYSLVKKNQYLINHTHFIFPTGVLALIIKKLTGLRYFITAHGSDVPGHNTERFKLEHKLFLPLWKAVLRNSERVTCASGYLSNLINDGLANNVVPQLTVIPNGIDINEFKFQSKKEKKILLLSRIFKFKGFQYFLEAIKDLSLDYEINIVGDGPYLSELIKISQRLDLKVNFKGRVEKESQEFHDLFNTSSIFVFLSEKENFPEVLLEAMSAGMAIISSDAGGCREVVGDAAILVEPRNQVAIRKSLLMLINDESLQRALGEKAKARIEKEFNWSKISRSYKEIIESLS